MKKISYSQADRKKLQKGLNKVWDELTYVDDVLMKNDDQGLLEKFKKLSKALDEFTECAQDNRGVTVKSWMLSGMDGDPDGS